MALRRRRLVYRVIGGRPPSSPPCAFSSQATEHEKCKIFHIATAIIGRRQRSGAGPINPRARPTSVPPPEIAQRAANDMRISGRWWPAVVLLSRGTQTKPAAGGHNGGRGELAWRRRRIMGAESDGLTERGESGRCGR